jgi:hypothetical protein
MLVRFGGVLSLMLVGSLSIFSSPAIADPTIFQCSENWSDKNGNYDFTHFFILQERSVLWGAKLRWDDQKIDLSVTTDSPVTIEAIGKTTAYMPLTEPIDRCVNEELAANPTLREDDGKVNVFVALACRAKVDMHEVPIDVTVTINRVTGNLRIHRRQDSFSQRDTEHYGSCKVSKPLL